MFIEIRLFAYFRDGRGKKLTMEFDESPQICHVIDVLDIPLKDISIMLKNGKDAQPGDFLGDGDYISLFPPVGGG